MFNRASELATQAKRNENLPQVDTFKPRINSGIKKDQMMYFQIRQGSTGMDVSQAPTKSLRKQDSSIKVL